MIWVCPHCMLASYAPRSECQCSCRERVEAVPVEALRKRDAQAIGWLSAELAERPILLDGNAPALFSLWESALTATDSEGGK